MTIINSTGRVFFSQYNAVATPSYVYTSAAATGSEDGWIAAKADNNGVAICVATLTASYLYYRIEGRFDTYGRPIEIYSKTKTSADSIDQFIRITEQVKELRIGVRTDSNASPNYFYAGLAQAESR